jgi:Predicted membrane protein (DUF2306)
MHRACATASCHSRPCCDSVGCAGLIGVSRPGAAVRRRDITAPNQTVRVPTALNLPMSLASANIVQNARGSTGRRRAGDLGTASISVAIEGQLMNSSSVAQSNPVGAIRRAKWALWLVLGAMTLSILVFVEMPYLTTATFRPTTRTYIAQRLITIIPHLMCGFVALCIGPLQFSNRLRQANIKRHRLLGKIYVAAIV